MKPEHVGESFRVLAAIAAGRVPRTHVAGPLEEH